MEQKKIDKIKLLLKILVVILCFSIAIFVSIFFTGCNQSNLTVYITNIEKQNTLNNVDYYLITYSNGTTSTFTIENGEDGKDVDINKIYEKYIEEYGNISYADFLREYLDFSVNDNSMVINSCLQSSLKIYTEFYTTSFNGYGRGFIPQYTKSVSVMCGSGVIYKIENDYTYVLTNYHVVYSSSANEDNGSNIANRIVGFLYGSEDSPVDSGTIQNGYTVYDYGDYGIEFTYVGGSIDYDIAVLKVETSKIQGINENIKAVELADNYYVGETAIAIGNPENEGISVTQGIVSVDNEYITLAIDDTSRNYRSIRIDTAIYGGSSGGGLFNAYGELIGITNAGDSEDQNINYAIPVEIVGNVAENILSNYNGTNATTVKKATLGVTVNSKNSKYVYNSVLGYGEIVEDIEIDSIVDSSIAENLNLQSGDIIKSITINNKEYSLNRIFEIGDILLKIKQNDIITISYKRNNIAYSTNAYTILESDIK